MKQKRFAMAISLCVVGILGTIGLRQARAHAPKANYPKMASFDQYLMADANAEIALARSAAPESISATRRFWCSGDMATKPLSRARMALYAWSSEAGCLRRIPRNFGT